MGAREELGRDIEGDGDAQIGPDGREHAERRAAHTARHLRAALGGGRAAHRRPRKLARGHKGRGADGGDGAGEAAGQVL